MGIIAVIIGIFSKNWGMLDGIFTSPIFWAAFGICMLGGFIYGLIHSVKVRADVKKVSARQRPSIIWPDPSSLKIGYNNVY